MKRWNLCAGILMLILGLLVIIFPQFWIKLVVTLLGLGAIVYGVYSLKYTKKIFDDTMYGRTILVKSIISISIGALSVLFPLALGNAAWSVMTWVLIFYLLAAAVLGFYAASLLKSTNVNRKRYFLENLGLVAVAVILILISPKSLGVAIIRILGIAAIVVGVGLIIFDIVTNKDIIMTTVEVRDDGDEVPVSQTTNDPSDSSDTK